MRPSSRPGALAETGSTPSERRARGGSGLAQLHDLIKNNPTFREAYQALAEVHLKAGERPRLAALKDDLRAIPNDAGAAGQLVQLLSERGPDGRPPAPSDLAEAQSIAGEIAARDTKGPMILAVASGFHRAGQLDLALPLARSAAAKLDTPAAHLALGDLLLAVAEAQAAPDLVRREVSSRPSRSTTACSRPYPARSRP